MLVQVNKEDGMKKWNDYDKINDLSEEINGAKKKKKTLLDAAIDVSIFNSTKNF